MYRTWDWQGAAQAKAPDFEHIRFCLLAVHYSVPVGDGKLIQAFASFDFHVATRLQTRL